MFIVNSHHKVLKAWADYRRTVAEPPRLLTLDRHTDTSRPFRRHGGEEIQARLIAEMNFDRPEAIDKAISLLNNDEHIVAAIEAGIVSSALVLAHNAVDTDVETYRKHKIICREVKGGEWNDVLDTSLLNRSIEGFDRVLRETGEPLLSEGPYILDVDLDYFTSFASIRPKDSSLFKELAKNAALVTVATEPEYVKNGAVDRDLTSEYLLGELKSLIEI